MAEAWFRQLCSMYFALSNMWSPELREGAIFKKTTFSNIVSISKWTILAWSCFSDSIKAFFMNQSNGPSGQSHWFLRSTQFYRAESITVSFFLFFTKKSLNKPQEKYILSFISEKIGHTYFPSCPLPTDLRFIGTDGSAGLCSQITEHLSQTEIPIP